MGDVPSGVEGSERLAARWDCREDAHSLDFGWIGEDNAGVWITCTPTVALARAEVLHGTWFDYVAGIEPTSDDIRAMSLCEQDALQVIACAKVREEGRRTRAAS